MTHAIFCTLKSAADATIALELLKMAKFTSSKISILMPANEHTHDFEVSSGTKLKEGAMLGAITGVALGGSLGWLAGIGALAIPGIGPIIAAGPIMGAITGGAVGGTICGIAGALVGLGVPEVEAKDFELKIQDGRYLLSVHSESAAEASSAKSILAHAGARDFSLSD